ncbi:MAG: hypothetical protein JNM17_32050 [Archangium sp.]|nr:hypothetical protein [Archangium sp.]
MVELASPFIAIEDAGPELKTLVERQPPSLLQQLLTDPKAIAERMLDPALAPKTMAHTVGLLLVSTTLTGAFLASLSRVEIWRAAGLLPVALVLAVAAAMGPVAATAVMAGARLPWQLLAAALTTAMTAGALTLAALAPIAVVAMSLNREWLGPLAVVGSFAIAGIVSGRRIHAVLVALAQSVNTRAGGVKLDDEALDRVRLVGRVAFVQLAFTTSLAIWSLKVL